MYNSSIKNQGTKKQFSEYIEIPNKIFFNDMSKNYMYDVFKSCDVIYSEIAWSYGYQIFNENAKNNANSYKQYIENVNKCIEELCVPAFIVCGKSVSGFFKNANSLPIKITTSNTNIDGCRLYIWNYDGFENNKLYLPNTLLLIKYLSKNFHKCLDFSCGYGQHLMNFDDFIACDIDKNCLTYLSILYQEKEKYYGKTENKN